jgi:hypothetical protein
VVPALAWGRVLAFANPQGGIDKFAGCLGRTWTGLDCEASQRHLASVGLLRRPHLPIGSQPHRRWCRAPGTAGSSRRRASKVGGLGVAGRSSAGRSRALTAGPERSTAARRVEPWPRTAEHADSLRRVRKSDPFAAAVIDEEPPQMLADRPHHFRTIGTSEQRAGYFHIPPCMTGQSIPRR